MKRCLMVLLLTALLLETGAWAASYESPYLPPEILHAEDLAQVIPVPPKVNINRANVNHLKALPGVDESIALKLMRMRPVEGFQDFYKMPWISRKEIERLIDGLRHRIEF